MSGLDAGDVEQIVDEPLELPGALHDPLGILPVRIVGRSILVGLRKKVGKAQDERQRRPQLVGHGVQERGLEFVEFLEVVVGRAQPGERFVEFVGAPCDEGLGARVKLGALEP